MCEEKTIEAAALIENLDEVLDEIHGRGAVYIVQVEQEGWLPDGRFVLGPVALCGDVVGLGGPGYGWPVLVHVPLIKSVWAMAPGHRRHPFICRGDVCLAVSIQYFEYEEIAASRGEWAADRMRGDGDHRHG